MNKGVILNTALSACQLSSTGNGVAFRGFRRICVTVHIFSSTFYSFMMDDFHSYLTGSPIIGAIMFLFHGKGNSKFVSGKKSFKKSSTHSISSLQDEEICYALHGAQELNELQFA